jgi:DNA-binding MarR family transcriptional regulator
MTTRRPTPVAEEIQQTRPFRSSGHEAVVTLFRTMADMERYFVPKLDAEGITPQQFNVLRILRGAGPAGLPTLAVAERMIDRAPGITRLIDRLVSAELVTRDRDGLDRRQVTCRITAQGAALLERLDPVMDHADREVVASLSPAEQRTLIRLLNVVRSGIPAPQRGV